MTDEVYQAHLRVFLEGATQMINTPEGYSTELHVDRGKRFDLARGNVTNPSFPNGYISFPGG